MATNDLTAASAGPGWGRRLARRGAAAILHRLGRADLDDPVTELLRVVRFGLVGGAATAAHMGTTVFLVELFALNPVLASTLGVCVSFWFSYYGHQMFSFAVERDHKAYLVRFMCASAIAFALNISVVSVNNYVLHLPYYFALAVLMVAIPATSYLFSRFWVFRAGLAGQRNA